MGYFKVPSSQSKVISRKNGFWGGTKKQPFFAPVSTRTTEQSIGDNTPAQMLMDIATFQEQTTSKSSRKRSTIGKIDILLAQYNDIGSQPQDFVKRKTALTTLQQACLAYLNHKSATDDPNDAIGDRIGGIKELMREIDLEMPVLNLCVEALVAIDNDTKIAFKRGMEARELFAELRESNPQMTYGPKNYRNIDIDRLFDLILQRMNADNNRSRQMEDLIEEDLAQLSSLALNPGTPPLLRTILIESLSNRKNIHFQETGGMASGAVLAGEKDREKGIDTKYRLDLQLNQTSDVIRQSSLLHEMTHIATQESFKNTPIHLAYKKGTSDAEILALSQRRTNQVHELMAIVGTALENKQISEAQYRILEEKTMYPIQGKNSLESYVKAFAKDIGPAETEHLLDLVAQGANNTLVEFDTVMNQMYFMVTQWGIAPNTPLSQKLAAIVEEAYQRRAEEQMVDL
ncbi:MAG: hypothetical protein IPL33_17050 [Sphingobacteriales bacterium]|nr:hypothetical protein [Sphingobacteriales bacterium]MCC7223631.1 hypothetical protein [Chitinophagales bacterium]